MCVYNNCSAYIPLTRQVFPLSKMLEDYDVNCSDSN